MTHNTSPVTIDAQLYSYCNSIQLDNLEAIHKHGSIAAAAIALGKTRATLKGSLDIVKRKAAMQGVAPEFDMTHAAPPGFKVKGTSTLYDKDGNKSIQWVKTALNADATEDLLKAFVAVTTEEIRGTSKPIPTPAVSNEDLLVVFPLGDPHVGMYSWGEETRADFDLDIAERVMLGAMDNLVGSAPTAPVALLLNLGDYFHNNDQSNTTPRSGAQLDVDGRMQKVLQTGIRIMLYAIQKLMAKYPKVIVRNVSGNHDGGSHLALALALDAFYHNEPRVIIELSPAMHWYYQHGKVLVGSTHGDKGKFEALPGIMACDHPEAWGMTRFRYWYVGHVHHSQVKELPGCIVETFRTLAASDAWHAGQGYRSGRDARAIILHKKYGEVGRYICNIAQIDDAAKATS